MGTGTQTSQEAPEGHQLPVHQDHQAACAPQTRRRARKRKEVVPLPPLGEVARVLWQKRTFRHLCAAFALASFVLYGTLQWVPTYFIRTYSLDTAKVGAVIALASGLFGGLSTFVGGLIGDRMAKHDVRWLCWLSAIGLVVNTPLMILMLFQSA